MKEQSKYSVSTYALIELPLEEAVQRLLHEGWTMIEIMGEGRHAEVFDWPEERLDALKRLGQDHRVIWSLHAPITGLNLASTREEEVRTTVQMLERSLEVAHKLECTHVVIHPGELAPEEGGVTWSDTEAAAARAAAVLSDALRITGGTDIIMALENVPPYPGLLGADADFLLQVLHKLPPSGFGIIFDVGHVHLTGAGKCMSALREVLPYVVGIHWSDNNGEHDDHMRLGAGTVPLREVVYLLQASDYTGAWVLELRSLHDVEASAAWLDEHRTIPAN
ncbi:sugar phosphate isomerase/epimerase [Paenibacillus sp. 32352]|uniref:sugar phosphate isomerase/epimerase family protein n=1 Tax=Paenibacillus sp. 32352 TaxID=1969111 RepID=UPI0009AF1230|nr:sugar phosphate isomerase/epimerase family protein [Paenibacillus sp. 32352]